MFVSIKPKFKTFLLTSRYFCSFTNCLKFDKNDKKKRVNLIEYVQHITQILKNSFKKKVLTRNPNHYQAINER